MGLSRPQLDSFGVTYEGLKLDLPVWSYSVPSSFGVTYEGLKRGRDLVIEILDVPVLELPMRV